MSPSTPLATYWDDLLTVALLGTDRRDVPDPPEGPLADLAADHPPPAPSTRLLQQVGACVAARRSGLQPAPAADHLAPPPDDGRPVTPPEAGATWRQVVADWPVLEDEWLRAVIDGGWRLAPDLVVAVLARHRSDGRRRPLVMVAAGPLASWLADHQHWLHGGRAPAGGGSPGPPPDLAIGPAWRVLLDTDPQAAAQGVAAMLAGGLSPADRAIVVNFLARVHPGSLPAVAAVLDAAVVAAGPDAVVAFGAADLVRLRRRMLAELEPRW
jgi:hypothetical protein